MSLLPFAGATVVSVFASSPEPWDAESRQMGTAKKKKAVASQAPQPQASLVITGDFIVTALWVFVSSTFAEVGFLQCSPSLAVDLHYRHELHTCSNIHLSARRRAAVW
jgi:hypothetical protein